ncbi:uncharacterized protein MEPE_00535 [Melanopsichium pennsylvanicum]|uniref:SH3 domain-containing protein n=2 Tax=Melanopsichium pennsylvanicum TaxID=63383 RepID=A0AAJ4XG38_9BASI|nr:sh3 domain-containing protein [Melanopsichium pennsylvanicum 4]SNX81830.1 uncharacterized protein MEPE_00535 [Melanopsichium pennsylvanicum]
MPAFPYLAKATIKYKSPHKQDLAFAKGDTIRVTGVAPKTHDDDDDDDDDWLVGETLDGTRSGTFPGGFVEPSDDVEEQPSHEPEATIAEATSAPLALGAIPTEAPTELQSGAVEEEPTHQADTIPQAAREAAQKGETEEAGFGAPLPPRLPSPDADQDAEEIDEPSNAQKDAANTAADAPPTAEKTTDSDTSKAAGATAAIANVKSFASETTPVPSTTEAKSDPAPAKPTPAVATKPTGMSSSFRDRLAAFNKPAESAAPPPLPKGKPGGWRRPTPASTENKPLLPGAPPATLAPASKPTSVSQPSETAKEAQPAAAEPSSGSGGAFSAADAQSSIKMSLKERMAALQRNEAAAAESAPQIKAKPSVPGKIGADRRNVALQGMGLGPGDAVPVRKPSVATGSEVDEVAGEPNAEQVSTQEDCATAPKKEVSTDMAEFTTAETGVSEQAAASVEQSGDPREALTEGEQEIERRAAIAKRMAALGARRMGGGPAMPLGAPTPPNRTKTTSSIGSAEGTTSEPGISIPADDSAPTRNEEAKEAPIITPSEASETNIVSPTSREAGEEPKVLAVPRRTAAPRKKKPVPGAFAAAAVAGEEAETAASAAQPEPQAGDADHASTEPAAHHIETSAAAPTEETASRSAEPVEPVTASHEEYDAAALRTDHAVDGEEEAVPQEPQEVAGEQQLDSDPEIAENQRQLEEYLRGEGFYEDQDESSAQHDKETEALAAPTAEEDELAAETEAETSHAVASAPVQREDVASPKPPSRPPSTRPPVPKTNLPSQPRAVDHDDAAFARASSSLVVSAPHRTSVLPPVPTSSLPTASESAAEEAEESLASAAHAEEEEETTGPILAVPRPRMAVPTEDPEDEELLAAAEASTTTEEANQVPEVAAEAEVEPEELTEEEQEAQRRANLARRMAALGGQRIGAFPGMAPPPIMGAPMPAKKAPVQAAEDTEETVDPEPQIEEDAPLSPSRCPPRGGMAIPGLTAVHGMNAHQAEGDALERARSPGADSINAPARLASPPPVPTSPPPKPLSPPPPARPLPTAEDSTPPASLLPGRPSSTVPMANLDEAVRSASPANNSLGRRTSMKPPVPSGIGAAHSRDSPAALGEYEPVEDRGMATSPPPLPRSPPPLPVSPPPRPSSRAPPLPGYGGIPPRRQGSSASSVSYGETSAVPSATTTTPAFEQQAPIPTPRTETSLPPIPATSAPAPQSNINVGARQSSRDLDLMPSSRWWRHGLNPLRLPPTVAGRPDAVLYADTSSSGDGMHNADIFMLFEDYSTTTISLSFRDDDHDEVDTSLTQRHSFPPPKPTAAELKQWSTSTGSSVAKLASDTVKQMSAPIGDGSSRAFIQSILAQIPTSLPPVGHSLGAPILTQVGPTIMESGGDEVRPGDIVSCNQADFRGKKGLAPYHQTFGTQSEPTVGVVIEVESKKNKLRCVIQSSNNKKGLAEEGSLRLDDLKAGIVKVYRVAPRQGWVNDW